jgi:tetratricopeptide (TPR) repeat protein
MTKSIIVLFARESSSVARVLTRLRAHFGAGRVIAASGQLPPSAANAVIVALLSASEVMKCDAGGGLPLDQFGAWDGTGLEAALQSDAMVLPMLLDGAVMPAHVTIPEPFHKIAFKHALPIRCGAELDRDVGRLINDLEQHLQYSPATRFAWDHWLVPIGTVGVLICSPYLVLWLCDAWYWNHAYTTAARYAEACWPLTNYGPKLLGTLLFVMAVGLAYRQHRRRVIARAEHFRTGKGELPPAENRWLIAARIFTWSSLGWGWWAGGLAVLSVIGALVRSAQAHVPRPGWRSVSLILAVSISASVWGLWRDALTNRLATALRENDAGRTALAAGQFDEAKEHFDSAIAAYPNLGRSYESLGLLYARQRQNEAAYREFSRAIALYPTGSRGLFGPDKKQIAATYRYRAQVASEMGQKDMAASDESQANELTPFIDIFGGFFRFW